MSSATSPTLELNNGVTMPALGLGVFQTPADVTSAAVEEALRLGYRHVDTAAAYGNDDPTLVDIARQHGKSAAQVILRWHMQEGRSAIPKSTKPARIAENFDIFDFELDSERIAAIDALDTGVRGGPNPDSITLENHGVEIAEA